MDLLLDTRVFIWWDIDDPRLSKPARAAIADSQNRIVVSAASVWEISIKRMTGKFAFDYDVIHALHGSGFEALDITPRHADAAGSLPLHHNDPFDRLLVAQAQLEKLILVSQDRHLLLYGVPTLGMS